MVAIITHMPSPCGWQVVASSLTYGQSDEFGYHVTENPVHVRDLHATILHLLGIDHHQFKHKFSVLICSRCQSITVVKELIA